MTFHKGSNFVDYCEDPECKECGGGWTLPLQHRPERKHLYRWIEAEEGYVAEKFDGVRGEHDEEMGTYDLASFWVRQVVQYYDRAVVFLSEADDQHVLGNEVSARFLEMKAQQAMAKAMMTAKGMVESSIRVFGPLPPPGVSSGEIGEWDWDGG